MILDVDKVLKECEAELVRTYESAIMWYPSNETLKNNYDLSASAAAMLGAQISPITKRLKIRAFLELAKKLSVDNSDDMTMTVGKRFAKAMIGRSINNADLMTYFTTKRTAANKVNVDEIVERLANSKPAEIWAFEYEVLLKKWRGILTREKGRFREKRRSQK